MGEFFMTDALEWRPLRPDVAQGVSAATLLSNGTRMMLVRVEPGGGFATHRDGYGHLFYFLEGCGVVRVEDRESPATTGLVVQVAAGEAHSYENSGTAELILISVNLPEN
ncbi:MAG TPA: cupin domain-containing protein [Geobacteraceae bacterium]